MKLFAIIHYLILVPTGLYFCIKDWIQDYFKSTEEVTK